MALIGSIENQGTLQGQVNDANGYLTGVISNAGLLGGQVVAERGLKGDKGDTGDTGATGSAATVSVGSTTTGAAGTSASVSNSGTSSAAIFDFIIPKGDKGDTGATGEGATIAVGSVSTGAAGTSASVVNSGTSGAAIFDFTIPKGDKGDTGNTGSAATIAVGSVATGAAGTSASVVNSGTSSSAIFDFTIPKGDKGDTGASGHSPVITASKVSGTTTVYVDGSSIATIEDGIVQDVEVNGTSVLNGNVAEVTVPTQTSQLTNNSLFARGHIGAFHGTCSTAAGTGEKAVTCADFMASDLVAGAMIVVEFDNANSAAVGDLKLNVNGTGAYAIKQNGSGTLSNLGDKGYLKASAYPFIFNGTYWICWYDTNTNTIGYTIRTNGLTLPVKTACYRYRICFTSPDGKYYVPANASTSTSATASKTVTAEKIDPFGRIIYYSYTTALSAGGTIGASYQMQQYNGVTLGYSFNRTGVALTMTSQKPVYVKCTPQTDGSAIIDDTTPFVQDLPTTEDGKIYIFIGVATSATAIEFTLEHPVYCYKNGCVRQWTNADIPTIPVTDVTQNGTSVLNGTTAEVTVPTDLGDLTNTAGYIKGMTILSYGSSTYADALAAFQAKKIVYCKASSNVDPSIGNQLRMAFLAYVNDATTPTEFEFQYYRSVATHSDSQQGDQVFVYKLTSSGTWSVTTREAYSKVVAGTNMSSSYSSGKITLSATDTTYSDFTGTDGNSDGTHGLVPAPQTTDANKYLKADGTWATVSGGGGDVVYATSSDSASTVAKTATIVSGTLTTLTSGVQAIVKFDNTNTASSPTLNIGGTGAKSIKRYGTTVVGQNQNESWVAGSPVLFVYDGTNWVIAGWLNTTYSGGTASGITTGTDNLNYIWSPKQIHDGIVGLADKNVQSDWSEADNTKDEYIKNKPTIPTNTSDLNNDSGFLTSAPVTDVELNGTSVLNGTVAEVAIPIPDDYVVKQGTSGNWLYRKWNSGRYEAWYDSGATTVTCSTSGGNGWYRNSSEYTINMPTGLGINTVRHAEVTVNTDYAYLVTSITHANSTYIGFYVSHLGSLSSVSAYCSAYVEGSWT